MNVLDMLADEAAKVREQLAAERALKELAELPARELAAALEPLHGQRVGYRGETVRIGREGETVMVGLHAVSQTRYAIYARQVVGGYFIAVWPGSDRPESQTVTGLEQAVKAIVVQLARIGDGLVGLNREDREAADA